MKKACKYTRFSSDGQSSFSIERQDTIIDHWASHNRIEIIDAFKDEGYTARTFDRPDVKELFSFIKKNSGIIDYLLVAELTRFSRETGDAINMVKKIQSEYNIKIASCSRGVIYDCTDPNSFFMMGLEFLLGHSENIKRTNDINGGIYTAKTVKGKWVQGGPAPFGYKKEGTGENRKLVIDEPKAAIVKFIYESYLANVPDYIILKDVRKQGFHLTGRSAIKSILKNPLYISQQHVKAYKQLPGGLFAGNWPTIIDVITWNRVQDKLNYKPRTKVAITDEMPLRGVLLCHCGKHLTGAPSRNRTGQYYNYYKCNVASSHNNISVIKAHDQLNQLLRYLNVPGHIINSTKQASEILLEQKEKENFNLLDIKRRDLEIAQKKLRSVEEKFINEQIDFETYSAWRGEITHKKNLLTVEIRNLDKDKNQLYLLLQKNLQPLTDMQYIYTIANTLQKQQLIRYVFDSSLYYQNKTYRTPYIMPIFSHNKLILKEKKLLIVDDINPNWSNSPVMWTPQDHNRTHTQLFDFLEFIESLHVA